ncbi:MAG: CHAT domain-containing protein [Microcystis sp. M_OC_Ca_00000000_S217Cul]|nr:MULTISPECIES: CHAT domain-containing protein [unclassified Microcystis]TRT73881.1 MAG: CHAT domain-containing protein [Microcystis sp. M_OC_Ca_00000000_S217Cul]TRT92677.1 MAG: CHAT domain-containing protein [Microcystis sp. M_OC_Ca_00000000_C217Col]
METRSETPRETWLQPIVALLGEGEFAEAYALAAYFPNTRNRQLVQLAALLGQNKFSEADTLLKKFAAETQSLVAEFATILNQVDLDLLETAYQAIKDQYFELADFCIQFQLLTHPETSLSVIREGLRLRKTEFVQDINSYVKGEPTIKVPPGKLAGGEADLNRKYIGNPGYFNSNKGSINERGEFIRLPCSVPCSEQPKPLPSSNSVTIQRHTRIEFPSECVLEQKAELKIQLTQEIPKFTRVLEKIWLTVGLNTKQVKLNVKVTAPAFAIRPYQQQLTVPVKGDSNEVIFTLVPLERGEQVIEIEFFRGATRVGYVIVQTNVTFYSYNKISPKVLSMEDPIDGLKNLESMTVNPDKHTLNVTWIERESKLLYTIFPANRLGEWEKTIPNIQQQIEDDLRSLNAFLTEVVQQGNPSDERWESICFNLQSVGANLFEMLIPSEVAKKVRDWKIGSPVIISTNEQWIPWELMYDGEDFWGKKFIIARSPRLSDSQDLPDKNRPESKGKRQIKRIVNIVGGDVPSSEAERATHLFSNLLPPEAVQLLAKQPISSLVKAIPGTDALHFTCHGHLEPHLLQIAGDKNKTRIENLLPETILRLPLEPGSLVFANACASTVPVLTFGKFSSFGWKFYQRGADAFIGTLGAVPVKYAFNFAEIVYRELFNPDEKITIGQAVAKAKEVAANERNLFWLLYCIYGDPDFSIVQQKNSKEEDHAN